MFGARWSRCCCSGVEFCGCAECGATGIPRTNLTLSLVGGFFAGSTVTLVHNGACLWQSVCFNQVFFTLRCNGGVVEFFVTYFVSGACPNGQSGICSTLGSNPLKIFRDSLTCGASFLLTAHLTAISCPQISDTYDGFAISA